MSYVNLTDQQADMIRRIGKEYTPALLPDDIERGPTGLCFDWSALQAAENRQYRYVEGIASSPEHEDFWILHGWLTDGEHAFDPTWVAIHDFSGKEIPLPCRYIGIEMPIEEVFRFMKKTGYQGVIANRWRCPQLADEILRSIELHA